MGKGESMSKIALLSLKIGKILPKIMKAGFKAVKGLKGVGIAASAGYYSFLFSWQMGIALTLFILIHEYGHLFAMKKVGIRTKGVYLIPGVGGAAVALDKLGSSAKEAYVAIMGPIAGIVALLLLVPVYYYTHNPMFAAIVITLAFINLINMIPINPLDGGRIVKSLVFSFGAGKGLIFSILSGAVAVFLGLYFKITLLAIIGYIGVLELVESNPKLKDYLGSFLKVLLRVLGYGVATILGLATWAVFDEVRMLSEMGEPFGAFLWTGLVAMPFLCILALIAIIHDVHEYGKSNILKYLLRFLIDIKKGAIEVWKLRKVNIDLGIEKMTKKQKWVYFIWFFAIIGLMFLVIMWGASIPGLHEAMELIR